MRSWVACLVALTAGCYDPPKPECGFICGLEGACPTGYACSTDDNRCHRIGSDAGCEGLQDAFMDTPGAGGEPFVINHIPMPGAIDIQVDAGIHTFFNEQVVGISESSYGIFTGGIQVPALYDYDGFSFRASMFPIEQLLPATTYTVVATADITDMSGHPLHPDTWQFTTGPDNVGPRLRMTSPMGGMVVPVTSSVIVTFDEPVQNVTTSTFVLDAGAGPISGTVVSPGGDPRTWMFSPDTALPAQSTIFVSLDGVTDIYGNALTFPSAFSFDTF